MPLITAVNGAGTTSPLAILTPWSASWRSRNVIHDLIGGDIAVSYATVHAPRSGTFQALYDSEVEAYDCIVLHHNNATRFRLTDSGRTYVDMPYVVDGELRLDLEADLRHWVVTIGYVRADS